MLCLKAFVHTAKALSIDALKGKSAELLCPLDAGSTTDEAC